MSHLPLLVRREFWEHRSFLIVPAVVAAILLLIMTFSHPEFDHTSLKLLGDPRYASKHYSIITILLFGLAFPYLVSMACLTVFYLLDSLYADRKDRSVLFWKSLPVSDAETVISKLVVATVVLPLMTFAAIVATSIAFGLIGSVRLSGIIDHVWTAIWLPGAWFDALTLMVYSVAVMVLWYLPIFGWLMLVSAWARRATILWAVLPPLALWLLEYGMFHTTYVGHMIRDRLVGWSDVAINPSALADRARELDGAQIAMTGSVTDAIDPATFFSSPSLWIGLIVAAAFIWGAILLRRRRSEA